jgi:hypothetical protein
VASLGLSYLPSSPNQLPHLGANVAPFLVIFPCAFTRKRPATPLPLLDALLDELLDDELLDEELLDDELLDEELLDDELLELLLEELLDDELLELEELLVDRPDELLLELEELLELEDELLELEPPGPGKPPQADVSARVLDNKRLLSNLPLCGNAWCIVVSCLRVGWYPQIFFREPLKNCLTRSGVVEFEKNAHLLPVNSAVLPNSPCQRLRRLGFSDVL